MVILVENLLTKVGRHDDSHQSNSHGTCDQIFTLNTQYLDAWIVLLYVASLTNGFHLLRHGHVSNKHGTLGRHWLLV